MSQKRKLIFICTGSDCKKSGSKTIRKELQAACKSSPLKGCSKLIQTKCLGSCKSAPVAILETTFLKKTSTERLISELKKSLAKVENP